MLLADCFVVGVTVGMTLDVVQVSVGCSAVENLGGGDVIP